MVEAMQQPSVTHIEEAPGFDAALKHELEQAGVNIDENKIKDMTFTVRPDREVSRTLSDEPINNPILTFEVSRMPRSESGLIVIHFESKENPEDTSFDIWFSEGEVTFDGNVNGVNDWAPSNDSSISSSSRIEIEVVNYNYYNDRSKRTEQHHQIMVSVNGFLTLIRDVTDLPNDFNVSIIVENDGRTNFSTTISDISLRSSTRRGAR